jgi:hypothetical protein
MSLADGRSLLQHLILDRLIRIGVVAVALVLLAIGMAVIWQRASRR